MKLASPIPCCTVIREYQMKETWNMKFCRQTFRVNFLNHSFEMVKKIELQQAQSFFYYLWRLHVSKLITISHCFSHHHNLKIYSEENDGTTTHANNFQETWKAECIVLHSTLKIRKKTLKFNRSVFLLNTQFS